MARNDLSAEKPIAVCMYDKDDRKYEFQATYDINVGRYVELDRARLVPTAMPHPYRWMWYQPSSGQAAQDSGPPADFYGEWRCVAPDASLGVTADKCQFVLLDPFK